MLHKNVDKLKEYAERLIATLPPSRQPCAGESGHISTASRLVFYELQKFYSGTGIASPTLEQVRKWFYSSCPDMAIAILHHRVTLLEAQGSPVFQLKKIA